MFIKNHPKFFTLVLLFLINISFGVSQAFVGDDLGIDLYNKIDSGIQNLESLEYSYELKGGKNGKTIDDSLNQILGHKGFGDCKVQGLTEEDIKIIVNGNIQRLSAKLSDECKIGGSLNIDQLDDLSSELTSFHNIAIKKAQNKSHQIYDISKIGLYQDGSISNSPFDLIDDINKINHIIFTQDIEYNGETPLDDNNLSNYLEDKLSGKDNITQNLLNESGWPFEELGIIEGNQGGKNNVFNFQPLPHFGGNIQYSCPAINTTGLTDSNLEQLLGKNSTGSSEYLNSNYIGNGGNTHPNNSTENISVPIPVITGGYSKRTDDSVWGCDSYFCITIDFILHNHNALGGEKMRSIQSIIEKSNEHIRKFVNTSLVQSKMTTNNFELGLRDLNLSDIFSFGMIISTKTPPILNLENFYKDKEKIESNKQLSLKNIKCKIYEADDLKCTRENDLTILLQQDGENKSLLNISERPISELTNHEIVRKNLLEEQKLIHDFLEKAIQRDAQLNETDQLFKEFLELERFVGNLQDYTENIQKSIKAMNKIPIHP